MTQLALVEARRAEQSVDALYLRASAPALATGSSAPRLLVVVQREFRGAGPRGFGLSVAQGDVLAVLGAPSGGWLPVRDPCGREGLVPDDITDSGFI